MDSCTVVLYHRITVEFILMLGTVHRSLNNVLKPSRNIYVYTIQIILEITKYQIMKNSTKLAAYSKSTLLITDNPTLSFFNKLKIKGLEHSFWVL